MHMGTAMFEQKNRNELGVIAGLLLLLVVAAACFVLRAAQAVILPLIIAWLLSYILGPVVTFMTRRRIPTGVAVTLVLLILLGICYLGGLFLHSRAMSFVQAYPAYQQRVQALLRVATQRWNLPYDPLEGINWWSKIGEYMAVTARPVVSFTSKLVLVIFYLVFLLLGKPYFSAKLQYAFDSRRADHISGMLGAISKQIGTYLSLQLLISMVTGVVVWLGLSWIGVDFAVTWGALAFFLNFIPNIGSILASIPPILVALVQFPTVWPAVGTGLMLLTIQMTIGNVIAPKVLGERLNLSPVVVLLSLVFWGWLWGVVGALLSVPIASAIKIVCGNIEPLRPISILMGSGRDFPSPPSPPVNDDGDPASAPPSSSGER